VEASTNARVEPVEAPVTVHAVREVTLARTRAVWIQDVGDGSDTFARGTSLRLMGLDSDDGRGERAILPEIDNYARPLLTSDGSRVVFSSRRTKTASVVNWDGTGLRTVAPGIALALWRDSQSGAEWVYFASIVEEDTYENVRRVRLDGASAPPEPVWTAGHVTEEFQVSWDGRRAAGQFPWPRVGLADLGSQTVKEIGTGCWTSLAPDRTNRMWYFDGAHRNLSIVDDRNGSSWRVHIGDAPGLDGHEVYHPRWSNHPRLMTMTGPYAVGSGENRIRGGGEGVEVYVGRFSPALTSIERWARLTQNNRADFYPDVWVDPAEASRMPADAAASSSPGPAAGTQAAQSPRAPIVVRARLKSSPPVPSPESIRPYTRALAAAAYEVEQVVSGQDPGREILVAHWVIADGRVMTGAARRVGEVFQMTLAQYDDRPELEGERLVMDSRAALPLFFDTGSTPGR
jgi:hypothetical protein